MLKYRCGFIVSLSILLVLLICSVTIYLNVISQCKFFVYVSHWRWRFVIVNHCSVGVARVFLLEIKMCVTRDGFLQSCDDWKCRSCTGAFISSCTGAFIRRWGFGQWCSAAGLIICKFSDWPYVISYLLYLPNSYAFSARILSPYLQCWEYLSVH